MLDPNIVNMCAQSDAVRAYPKSLKWLSAWQAKQVGPDRCDIDMGDDYEVWFCRKVALKLWHRAGTLAWARASVQALESGR